MTVIFLLVTCFLAYVNGANDNFKGVASLFGSRTANYRTAIGWATLTTFAGSVCSIFLAQTLLQKFTGKGLVPDQIVSSEYFLLAVAIGAGLTVLLATLTGFPISTTHGLMGAIVGSGLVAAGSRINFRALGRGFIVPLVLSPVLACALAALAYVVMRFIRLRLGITKEWCVCVGDTLSVVPIPQPSGMLALRVVSQPIPNISIGEQADCEERYAGRFIGLSWQRVMDSAHFLSAGLVSFARGLNDTPKIAAILLVVRGLQIRGGALVVALAMAIGGLLNAKRVAETMGHRITGMNHGQGFAANLSTGILVTLASVYGLPVSTTHVAVGALSGIGWTTGKGNPRVIFEILLSWVLTLPCAAVISGLTYWLTSHWR